MSDFEVWGLGFEWGLGFGPVWGLEWGDWFVCVRVLYVTCVVHYFNQGAKGLEFGQKTFKELVNDYADAVYSSMFSGLDANRNWLTKADFLLVVDAGVKGHFPSELLDGVPRLQLERTILQAVEIQEGSYFLDELA